MEGAQAQRPRASTIMSLRQINVTKGNAANDPRHFGPGRGLLKGRAVKVKSRLSPQIYLAKSKITSIFDYR